MAPTNIPAKDQPFDVVIEGVAPPLTFSQAGKNQIFLTGLSQHIDPKNADGSSVWPGGKDVSCTLDPGQDAPLWESGFTVDPTPTPAPTPTPPRDERFDFNLKGETFVKAPNGNAPLSGTVGADLNSDTSDVVADLPPNKTRGNFLLQRVRCDPDRWRRQLPDQEAVRHHAEVQGRRVLRPDRGRPDHRRVRTLRDQELRTAHRHPQPVHRGQGHTIDLDLTPKP